MRTITFIDFRRARLSNEYLEAKIQLLLNQFFLSLSLSFCALFPKFRTVVLK